MPLTKTFWPKEGFTKGDLIAYYERIAPVILPYLAGRPESLHRFPDGIRGEHFYQKDTGDIKLPRFAHTRRVRAKSTGESPRYLLCDNAETLRYLANLGCIEMNPWNSRVGSLGRPDYLVFDLDPSPANSFDDVIAAARALHTLLETIGLPSYPKTSGKRGIHVYAPLSAKYPYERVRAFAKRAAAALARERPELASVAERKSARRGKIYIDVGRNAQGQTTAAPYSARPFPGATVSAPLDWREVKKGLDPTRFTIKTIFSRLARKGDLWKPVLGRGADLAHAEQHLSRLNDRSEREKNRQ